MPEILESIKNNLIEIENLEDKVRGHINTHRYQENLLKDLSTWNQICSSLDVIGDTVYAIKDYIEFEFPENYGLKYIYLYGLLQALFIQQDAMKNLSEALGLDYELSNSLKKIRNIRNASIGHPTKQNIKGEKHYNYISRITIGKFGFELLSSSESREYGHKNINLQEILIDQTAGIKNCYKQLAEKLEEIDQMHKEKFKEKPLLDIFHSALGYILEKIGQGISAHSTGDRDFGLSNIKILEETYSKFENSLKERRELNEYTQYDLNEYKHAIERLKEFLSGNSNTMQESDARIYLH